MQPKFNSGFLFDSVNKTANKKLNGIGAINVFRAWGFPCVRQSTALISMFGLKKGDNTGNIVLSKLNSTEETKVASFNAPTNINNSWINLVIPLLVTFNQKGRHYFKAILQDSKSVLKIHFIVDFQKWPNFSKEELDFVREHPIPYGSIRADIQCKECSHAYIFEETILEGISPPGGVIRFPESGEFQCSQCKEKLFLSDIQGQMRFSLKELITNGMRSK